MTTSGDRRPITALPPGRRWARPVELNLAFGRPIGLTDCANDRDGWIEAVARCEIAAKKLAGI